MKGRGDVEPHKEYMSVECSAIIGQGVYVTPLVHGSRTIPGREEERFEEMSGRTSKQSFLDVTGTIVNASLNSAAVVACGRPAHG